jgi:glycosyltransferase involved in cell wall biosynthesis
VVIPCYNARRWIGEAVASVIDQAVPGIEIIVVDDGSDDGSGELAASLASVRLVRTQRGGPSRARNLGTSLTHGTFIQYLDADDLLAPGKLRIQLELLERTGADVTYGDWCELRDRDDGGVDVGHRWSQRIEADPEIALFKGFWCPPATYLFRRSIVDATGGWDEQLPIIQDARFVLDCALRGASFVYWPCLAAYYRVHNGGSVSTRDQRAFTRDCLRNAVDVEAWWREHGGLTADRRAALLQVYGHIARTSFGHDPPIFEHALAALEQLQPGYAPDRPWHLAVASRVMGYRRAEALAVHYRGAKHRLRHLLAGRRG